MGPEVGPVGVGEISAGIASAEATMAIAAPLPSIEASLPITDAAVPPINESADILKNTVPYGNFWKENIASEIPTQNESLNDLAVLWQAPKVEQQNVPSYVSELITIQPGDELPTQLDSPKDPIAKPAISTEEEALSYIRAELKTFTDGKDEVYDLLAGIENTDDELPKIDFEVMPDSTIDVAVDGIFNDGIEVEPTIRVEIAEKTPEIAAGEDDEAISIEETEGENQEESGVNTLEEKDVIEANMQTDLEESVETHEKVPEQEVEQKALQRRPVEKDDQEQAVHEEQIYMVDNDANEERREMAQDAVHKLIKDTDSPKVEVLIRGKQVAELLPMHPTERAKSEIADDFDGSFQKFRQQIGEVEEFGPESGKIIGEIIDMNNAVGKKGVIKATTSEIEKVLGIEGIENQIYPQVFKELQQKT